MSTILRVTYKTSLPNKEERNRALRDLYGDISILEWEPPEDPRELFTVLRDTVFEKKVVAVEIDSDDRVLTAALGLAADMAVVPSNRIPILLPTYDSTHHVRFPDFEVVKPGTTQMKVLASAKFNGFLWVHAAVAASSPLQT